MKFVDVDEEKKELNIGKLSTIAPDRIDHLLEKHGQAGVLPGERYQNILFRFMLAIMDELKIMKKDNSEAKES